MKQVSVQIKWWLIKKITGFKSWTFFLHLNSSDESADKDRRRNAILFGSNNHLALVWPNLLRFSCSDYKNTSCCNLLVRLCNLGNASDPLELFSPQNEKIFILIQRLKCLMWTCFGLVTPELIPRCWRQKTFLVFVNEFVSLAKYLKLVNTSVLM